MATAVCGPAELRGTDCSDVASRLRRDLRRARVVCSPCPEAAMSTPVTCRAGARAVKLTPVKGLRQWTGFVAAPAAASASQVREGLWPRAAPLAESRPAAGVATGALGGARRVSGLTGEPLWLWPTRRPSRRCSPPRCH
jgi:hypothetical protein